MLSDLYIKGTNEIRTDRQGMKYTDARLCINHGSVVYEIVGMKEDSETWKIRVLLNR